jgi:hypothetical protein
MAVMRTLRGFSLVALMTRLLVGTGPVNAPNSVASGISYCQGKVVKILLELGQAPTEGTT